MRGGIVLIFTVLLLAACDGEQKATTAESKNEKAVALVVEQVVVPAGEFIRGSNREDDLAMRQQYGFPEPLFVDEHPQKKIHLDAFKIDTYEVSNKQFKAYVLQTRRMLPYAWMSNGYAITDDQLQMLDVDKLRKMATDVFAVDMDTRQMDKPALVAAMLKQQQQQDKFPVTGVSWFAAKDFCAWRQARLAKHFQE